MPDETQDNPYNLIPGILPPKRNCQLHYAYIASVFITLLLLVFITGWTATTVVEVNESSKQIREIVLDLRNIIPKIVESYDKAQRIQNLICVDKNFTKWYPKYHSELCIN